MTKLLSCFNGMIGRKIVIVLLLSLATSLYASEESVYNFLWLDPDKSVFVLQNKTYEKERTFFVDLYYLSHLGSEFQDTSGFDLRGGYYFKEEWGIELFQTFYSNDNNANYKNVLSVSSVEPFIRRPNSLTGVMGIWSPFYGKVNTFNKIFYFDWGFGLGYAMLKAESNIDAIGDVTRIGEFKDETYNGIIYKTHFKVHINRNLHLGIELRNMNYFAPGPRNKSDDKLRRNTDFLMGIGAKF
jgi:outer membrane beta-barrel protein